MSTINTQDSNIISHIRVLASEQYHPAGEYSILPILYDSYNYLLHFEPNVAKFEENIEYYTLMGKKRLSRMYYALHEFMDHFPATEEMKILKKMSTLLPATSSQTFGFAGAKLHLLLPEEEPTEEGNKMKKKFSSLIAQITGVSPYGPGWELHVCLSAGFNFSITQLTDCKYSSKNLLIRHKVPTTGFSIRGSNGDDYYVVNLNGKNLELLDFRNEHITFLANEIKHTQIGKRLTEAANCMVKQRPLPWKTSLTLSSIVSSDPPSSGLVLL